MQLSGPAPHFELKHGSLTGILPECGTVAYSNSYLHPREGLSFRQAADKFGIFGQCVSLAKQFLWNHYGLVMPEVSIAAQIFFLTHVYDEFGQQVKLKSVRNGTREKPVKNSLIIYRSRPGNPVGHIGILVNVTEDRVYVADQNRFNHSWGADGFSASFPLEYDPVSQVWTIIDDGEPVLGWCLPVLDSESPKEKKRMENHKRLLKINSNPKKFIKADEEVEVFRPLPESLRKNFPVYDSTLLRSAWCHATIEFVPPENPFVPRYFYYISNLMHPVRDFLEKLLF
jgi:hypothetical protein